MNLSTLLGFALSFAVFLSSILMSTDSLLIFLNLHALIIVVGGTIAASLVCFSLTKIAVLLKVFARRIMGRNQHDYAALMSEIVALSKASIAGKSAYEGTVNATKNPFLKDAASVLFWVEADVSSDKLRDLLETRVDSQFAHYMDEANMFRTMAKFPPAFGLLGTTLGMITLLQSLGSENARNTIGPAMAIGLVATLHGIALANFVFIPIAEHLTKLTKETRLSHRMSVEAIMLIHEGLPTKFVEEKVRSYLLPGQRSAAGGSSSSSSSYTASPSAPKRKRA